MADSSSPKLVIVIFGASGDLTKRKLLPALFNLYLHNHLPPEWLLYGFARTPLSNQDFAQLVHESLSKVWKQHYEKEISLFCSRCRYFAGSYESLSSFQEFKSQLIQKTGEYPNFLFYMSIPPMVFIPTLTNIKATGLSVQHNNWVRIVLEKPFGHDLTSAQELISNLKQLIPCEDQIYRIDHYLGKEVIQNLLILRFANSFLEPVWNRHYIENVHITFAEDIGVGDRAGYFDQTGIIRDVIQNHLLQILALVAMEQPYRLTPEEIAQEKIKVFRAIESISPSNVITGQYIGNTINGHYFPGYLEEKGVAPSSITETFARIKLYIQTPRWWKVPFTIQAGKGLNTRKTEILIVFKRAPFSSPHPTPICSNKMRIRVQPDESIMIYLNNKLPGHGFITTQTPLQMHYQEAFQTKLMDAYERLLHDVVKGDRNLFITNEEVLASWQVITPILEYLRTHQKRPLLYPFGSEGPLLNLRDEVCDIE